ncbi:MAG: hypothetical protein ABI947_16370 [Chloroflexota bacterium]
MPDTIGYMVMGYTLAVIILVGLVAFLVIRARSLRAELEMLKTLDEEGELPAKSASGVLVTK